MQWNDKLVSIIVLCYQNTQQQIRNSLTSIFEQTYPRIEVVISDDGSSVFDMRTLKKWIDQNKPDRFKRTLVLHNEENQGTVRNLKNALQRIQGDYYMTVGAGDTLAKDNVITSMMLYASVFHYQDLLITGKAVHIDEKLDKRTSILNAGDYVVLRQRDAQELFSRLVYRCCIATTATLYRRDFPQIVDAYDEGYCYYEDYPAFLRMARKGITPLFIDKLITFHPMGGIANGAGNLDLKVTETFHRDRERLYQLEIKPYLKQQSHYTKTQLKVRRDRLEYRYLWELWGKYDYRKRIMLMIKHPWRLFWSLPKGIAMLGRIFRGGVFCLLMLSLFQASSLFSGRLAECFEWLMLAGAVVGCLANVIYWGYDACVQLKTAYRNIVISAGK